MKFSILLFLKKVSKKASLRKRADGAIGVLLRNIARLRTYMLNAQ
jgi:hypothetical protein